MKYTVTLILLFALRLVALSQEAIKFEPGVISDDGIFGLTISPDGNHAFWVRSQGRRDSLVIMESIKIKDKWQTPKLSTISKKGQNWRDIDPMFTPDGNTVIFQSNRPVEGKPDRKRFDLWAIKKEGNSWSDPYHMGNVVNTDSSESFASATEKGSIYYTRENGTNKGDIFMSKFTNGQYETPVSIGSVINTKEREGNPFISPKEDYIIYASPNPSNPEQSDLVVSFRIEGNWSVPVSLGERINSELSEFCPFVHQKEDRLYFCRLQRTPERINENAFYIDNFKALLAKTRKSISK